MQNPIIENINTRKGEVTAVRLTNNGGAWVRLCSIGACVMEIGVPDRDGRLADVVMGYADIEDYHDDGHCSGKIAGRYANRIARGHLEIDGSVYALPINNGPNTLHGGNDGLQNQIWDSEVRGHDTVVFTHVSPAGHSGFPGKLALRVTYRWTEDCQLAIDMEATTDAPTVVNLTNHTYFNLSGHDSGSALGHLLKLQASRFLPTDDTLIPTGEMAPVDGSPMDFSEAHALGRDIAADFPALNYGRGYDSCWVIDDYEPGVERLAATLTDPASGRTLEFVTDQPGIQVYTGNWIGEAPVGKSGRRYVDYGAVALECQDLPDAPHQPLFPSTRLNPGERFHRRVVLRFSSGVS